MNESFQKTLLRGVVRIYDKDKGGAALQLCLQTDGFDKYIIDNDKISEQLFYRVGEEVLVACKKYNSLHDNLEHVIIESFKVVRMLKTN